MHSKNEPPCNVITLAFSDSDLEAAFREDYYENRLPQLRLDLLFGVFLFALFGIHDYWVIPDIKEFAWFIRYCIVCPILIGILIFSYSGHFRKILQTTSFIAGFTAGAGVVLMIIKASPPGNYMSYAGLLVCLLFYFRLRFITCAALTCSIFILYEVVALWDSSIPAFVLYSNTFIFFTFSITGMFMCYTWEQNLRSKFLLRRTIQERNNEIGKANRELEKEIIERKQAETALLEQMEFLQILLDTIPNPIFYTDVDNHYAGCNKAHEDFFGRKKEMMAGKPVTELHFSDTAGISGENRNEPGGDQGTHTDETLLIHADGTTRKVLFSKETYVDIKGNPAGQVCVIIDITDLKQAEEAKLRLEAQLFQAQKMEAVGQLAGGIAHEFNNILTAILGYAHFLRKKMVESDPLYSYVCSIMASGERAAHLIRDLLAFSRKQKIEPKLINLNEITEKAEALLSMMIGEETELAVSVCDTSACVMADTVLMRQVLINLATNARDAMPKGGLLTISSRLVHFDQEFLHAHGSAKPGMYGVISVSDAGTGMDQKTKERIFEPFFTTKEVGKGTGLGLSMAYGIINQHHGYINVESKVGRGTTFSIYLPVITDANGKLAEYTPQQPHAAKPVPMQADAVREQGRYPTHCHQPDSTMLLIAEDNNNVRTMTKKLLQDNGYMVVEAIHGEDAVQRFMEHPDSIRLLLLDVIMPKKNGWEVYETIRAISPDVHVIFMSGYTSDLFQQRFIPEEGMNLLTKPVSPDELLEAVRRELDKPCKTVVNETDTPDQELSL
jgi:PAS domain S-box-containing protein